MVGLPGVKPDKWTPLRATRFLIKLRPKILKMFQYSKELCYRLPPTFPFCIDYHIETQWTTTIIPGLTPAMSLNVF
jgi:hypothetical protein